MKKISCLGFMLTEALIVSTFVVSVLIFLFIQFKNINRNYQKSFSYNNVNDAYAINNIKNFFDEEVETFSSITTFESNDYIILYNDDKNAATDDQCQILDANFSDEKIICTSIMKSIEAQKVIIAKENSNLLNNIEQINDPDIPESLKEFIKSIDNNTADAYSYRIIVKFLNDTYSSMLYTSVYNGIVDYVVTYDNNGGSGCTSKFITALTGYGQLCTPTRSGYMFGGWKSENTVLSQQVFTGSNYITLGRSYMYTDKISIHLEAYMSDWSKYANGMRLISCTEDGGWNIESASGYIQFPLYDSGVGYKRVTTSITWASLSAGWHSFDFVFNGTTATAYIDNVNVGTTDTFSSSKIGYNSTNGIFIGAEAGANTKTPAGSYFVGKIKNVIIKNSDQKINSVEEINANSIVENENKTIYASWIPNEIQFAYTGSEQVYTTLVAGTYKLEVWGAQGGYGVENGAYTTGTGGNGGYATGEIHLGQNQNIYINIGGAGGNASATQGGTAGYNGGAAGKHDGNDNEATGGGGGATHIATTTGLLQNLENSKSNILIVAGGGGGGAWTNVGGHGGGYIGTIGNNTSANPASQTFGYAFGLGGQGISHTGTPGGAGGGGFYGGLGGQGEAKVGFGGSGYIGNALLTNKAMYCYNCSTSDEVSTKTISTTCANATAITNCSKQGHGYAKIIYIGD